MLCNIGAVQQLHCFPVVSSQVLKITLKEERGCRLIRGQETQVRQRTRRGYTLIHNIPLFFYSENTVLGELTYTMHYIFTV